MYDVYTVVGYEGVKMEKIEEKREKKTRVYIMVGSVLLSVVVTIVSALSLTSANSSDAEILSSLDSVNLGISLLLGCSTFMIIELISLVFYSISYTKKQLDDEKFMDNITEYSNLLHDINRFYYTINKDSHGDNDLFVVYAKKEIEKLHNILSKAANQKEFSILSDYIINAGGVFDSFSQTREKVLKMTFPIMEADPDLFVSKADLHFFEVLKTKVEDKIVDKVQVIVIPESKELVNRPDVSKLLDFFHAEPNYQCKIVLKKDFEAVCDTNGVSSQFIDFGIYGPKMLYVTEQYVPVHKGTYYKDELKIKHYHRLFDEVWESDAITLSNPSNCTDRVPLTSLIGNL